MADASRDPDPGFWSGRRVLLTGHTGFKGSWLALWLQCLGAEVSGVSAALPSRPALYEVARVGEAMAGERTLDVRDAPALAAAVRELRPEVVLHLAAQPLVRRSYREPQVTFATNVMGTVNLLEAVRVAEGVRAIVVVTSDKCYENPGDRVHREEDPLGGHDPYSASKAAAEIVAGAYRRSFLTGAGAPALATARAGNVFGGGDWGEERLVPDIVRAVTAGATLRLRNPDATRPWQHVLNPLSGYLLLAERLWAEPSEAAGAWNLGPPSEEARTVGWIVEAIRRRWDGRPQWEQDGGPAPHEAGFLQLDSSRARERLGWRPPVSLEAGLDSVVEWHRAHMAGDDMRELTLRQIRAVTPVAS